MTSPQAQTIERTAARPVQLAAVVTDTLAGGWCVALVALTLLLLWRRLAGALTAPASDATLLAACLAVALLSLLAAQTPLPRYLAWMGGAGPLALAAVLSFPESGWPVWLMLWSVAAVPLAIAAAPWAGVLDGSVSLPRTPRRVDALASDPRPAVGQSAESGEADSQRNVVQQLTRGSDATGSDTLVGRIRVTFEAGTRSQRAHVAFCPPFATVPGVTLEASDPSGPQIRIGQVLPQGVRFDLKRRSGGDANAEVEIRFRAVEQSAPEGE